MASNSASPTAGILENGDLQPSAPAQEALIPHGTPMADGERTCVICLSAPVQVMLLPCRHAVLCQDCAKQLRARRGTASSDGCPMCRTRILGDVRGVFAEDYVRLVNAVEMRLDRTQVYAYEGMYNNIRPLLLVGALSAAGSAACFCLMPLPVTGAVLATTAVVVGYLPWFLTTAAAFETEDLSTNPLGTSIFSRDDLRAPLTLTVKAVVVTVAVPVAACTFYIPYAAYNWIFRPGLRLFAVGLLRGVVFSFVYILRPVAQSSTFGMRCICYGIASVCEACWAAACAFASAVNDFILTPASRAACFLLEIAGRGCSSTWGAIYQYILTPMGHLFLAAGRGAWAVVEAMARGIAAVATATYKWFLSPIGRAIDFVARMVARGIEAAFSAIGRGLSAVADAIARGLGAVAHGVAGGLELFWGYVLEPVLLGIWAAIRATASGAYSYVLAPLAQAAFSVVSLVFRGVYYGVYYAVGGVVLYIVAPLAKGTWWAACGFARALGTTATALFQYVLLPVGHGARAAARAFVDGVVGAARAVYTYILAPSGRIAKATAGAIASAIVATASLVYATLLVPIGHGIRVVGRGIADGARAVHGSVLLPMGRAARGAAVGAGTAVRGAASEAARIVRSVASAVRQGFRAARASMREAGRAAGAAFRPPGRQ